MEEEGHMSEDRLTRIEGKLDKMSEAITLLARMEERMITLFKRMEKYDEAQAQLVERVNAVEKVTIQRSVVYHIIDKGFWLVVGAGLAYIVRGNGG
jgi:C4-type Zn-finger protein